VNLLVIAFAVVGGIWGIVADRIATRWPEHDEPELPGDRPPGWRTVVNGAIGAVALGALPGRFDDTTQLALFGAWFLVLTLLLATDLDQRLLPSAITLPLIVLALIVAVSGVAVDLHDTFGLAGAIGIAIAIPLGMYLISIPFGVDAVGQGDLILLVSVGLFEGLVRTITGIVVGAFLGGVVIAALILTRRVTRRTYIPYGPFLIIGAFWGVLVRFG
jgi:prepilin signal peptidase PulO-like enzyme (type II secretory pathway)